MSVSEAAAATCPATWQPPLPRLRRARRMPWPLAVAAAPLLWLMPRRMGPHFAAVRWPGVILAHLLWSLWGCGWMVLLTESAEQGFYGYLFKGGPPPPDGWSFVSEVVRGPFVVLLERFVTSLRSTQEWLFLLGVVLLWEVGLVLLGLAMLPFSALGERPRGHVGRCIKLSLWSTTMLAVPAILLSMIFTRGAYDQGSAAYEFWHSNRTEDWLVPVTLICWLWVFVRSLMDGAAPADERLTTPQPLCCEGCGYAIGGLDRDGRCPECGRVNAESLPAHREATPLATASWLGSPAAFLRTWWRAMFQRGFYEHLAVHGEYETARRFAGHVLGLAGLLMIVLVGREAASSTRADESPWPAAVAVGLIVGLWPLPLIGLRLLFDLRDPLRMRRHATVVFYALAWHIPMLATFVVVLAGLDWLDGLGAFRGEVFQIPGGPRVSRYDLAAVAAGLLPLAVFVLAVVRIRTGIRQTRFAGG